GCAGLRFASQGRYRSKLAREFAPMMGPRPRHPWDPWAVSDPRIAETATQRQTPYAEPIEKLDDRDDEIEDDEIEDDEEEERPSYPGRPRAPRVLRHRMGSGADEPSGEARALFERFYRGLKGELSSPTENGICYQSPIPYLKLAHEWALRW